MKKVIQGEVLHEKVKEALQLLCGVVKTTLGPKGRNAIIDHSSFSPFITNDGETIAENIESEDAAVCAILEIAKEASIKTNEVVGDGTTTTLVLLESLYFISREFVQKGENPILLKKEITQLLPQILSRLEEFSIEPTEDMITSIATVSSGETEIGNVVSEILKKVDSKAAVSIIETEDSGITFTLKEGYTVPVSYASSYFFKGEKEEVLKDAYFFMIQGGVSSIEAFSFILNDMLVHPRPLVILATQFDDYFVNELTSFQLSNHLEIVLLQIEEYGMKQKIIQNDLAILTNTKVVDAEDFVATEFVSIVPSVVLTKDTARFEIDKGVEYQEYLNVLKEEVKSIVDAYDKEFYLKRISMAQFGLVEIKLGGPTKTERRERKMRLEDALCAAFTAKNGILPGGGLSLLQVSCEMEEETPAQMIWKNALFKPFQQILANACVDWVKIQAEIEQKQYQILFNAKTETYESVASTKVLDPFDVVERSLVNACSIAMMLLTTECLIINEHAIEHESNHPYSKEF